jgi:hypothetical protein
VLFRLEPAAENLTHSVVDNLAAESAKNFLTQVLVAEAVDRSDEILRDCIGVIKAEHSRQRVAALKRDLHEAEQNRDTARAAELLAALKAEIS